MWQMRLGLAFLGLYFLLTGFGSLCKVSFLVRLLGKILGMHTDLEAGS